MEINSMQLYIVWVLRAIYDANGRLFFPHWRYRGGWASEKTWNIWITWLVEPVLLSTANNTILLLFNIKSLSKLKPFSTHNYPFHIQLLLVVVRRTGEIKKFVGNSIDCAINSLILYHDPQSEILMYQFAQNSHTMINNWCQF